MDLDDVQRSDVVLAFTERPEVGYTTGGRWVEFGYAIALGITVIVVGPRENIFCHLQDVTNVESMCEALSRLESVECV